MLIARRLNVRFFAILTLFVGAVFVFYREAILGPPLAPLTLFTARATASLLQWLDMDVVRRSTVIVHSRGFAYEVYYRCTGFLPVAFLVVSMLAYQASWRSKLLGISFGVPALLVINLVRLVHLFSIGVHHRALFDIAHSVVWEGVIVLAIIATWLAWTVRVDRSEKGGSAAPGELETNSYHVTSDQALTTSP